MYFASDNSGPVHPQIMTALTQANQGFQMGYGADDLMDQVRDRLRTLFEAPQAAIYLVPTGTAANALALATMSQPWQTVFCSPTAHIHEDECNAPEFYSGGAKLTLAGNNDKVTPEALQNAILAEENRGVHGPQRGPVSITQVTERGQVYSLDELGALCATAQEYGLKCHLDGARFANALVALECTPAEMTWKAGIDAVSFGGTKNGCMGVEAVIFFDPAYAWEFELRRKRGAHLFSKHRYLSAQMHGYLQNDLWLDNAKKANDNSKRLLAGLSGIAGFSLEYPAQANILFANMPRHIHQRLHENGAIYHLIKGELDGADPDAPLLARLVCDWSITHAQIDQFIQIAQG